MLHAKLHVHLLNMFLYFYQSSSFNRMAIYWNVELLESCQVSTSHYAIIATPLVLSVVYILASR